MNGNLDGDAERGTANESMTPGFLGGKGGGEKPVGLQSGDGVANDLKQAEKAAENASLGSGGADLTGARENEERAGGFYSGSGKVLGNNKKKGMLRGKMARRGPIFAIIFAIFGVGGVMTGAQFFQPFSLIAQFQETFNSMHVSANARSERFFRMQMSNGRTKNPIKGNAIFGRTFKISEKQSAELKKQGIEFDDSTFKGSDGEAIKVLKYNDGSGEIKIVAADEASVRRLNELDLSKFDTGDVKYNAEAVDFKKIYADNPEFFSRYNAGSMTWRGQIANWFGTKTNQFLSNNKLTRNLWENYRQKATEAEVSGKTRLDVVKEAIQKRINGGESGGLARRGVATDEDGNRIPGETTTDSNTKVNSENVRSKINDVKSKISGGINVGCAVADFVGVVSLMATAQEALQIINLATSYMEAVDKTKAGYGDDSPINELMNTLNDSVATDHEVLVHDNNGQIVDDGGNTMTVYAKSETVKGTNKSAMQSAGVAGIYGNGYVDPNDASVQSFNLTGSAHTILGGLGMSMASFRSCTIGRTVAAVGNIVSDVILCLTTACIGTVVKDFAFGVGIGLALAGVIAVITPWITSVMTRDIVSTLAGEDLGNALVSGANMYQGNTHKANGGSLATRDEYTQFAITQEQVIAENARLERESLNPFDITSKNTFMGSIMAKMMGFVSANSLMSEVVASSTMMTSSLAGLMPSTSAIASQVAESLPTLEEYEETCPYLASIGAVGDSYCNPYMITDMETIDYDPADVIDHISDQFEDEETADGNVIIKKDSELKKYAVYCGERTSAFGIADQNIASDFKTGTGSTAVDTIIGAAPIFGDLVDIFDNADMRENIGYISGESCVAGNDLDQDSFATSSPKWGTAKYYQRFIEDQSLAESMGLIEESAVTVALKEYYEENPLDDSYEGMLARYSGLDKETMSDTLDVIAYFMFVGEYNPSERYAFGESIVDAEPVLQLENENVLAGGAILAYETIYADVRNRNFAV